MKRNKIVKYTNTIPIPAICEKCKRRTSVAKYDVGPDPDDGKTAYAVLCQKCGYGLERYTGTLGGPVACGAEIDFDDLVEAMQIGIERDVPTTTKEQREENSKRLSGVLDEVLKLLTENGVHVGMVTL